MFSWVFFGNAVHVFLMCTMHATGPYATCLSLSRDLISITVLPPQDRMNLFGSVKQL